MNVKRSNYIDSFSILLRMRNLSLQMLEIEERKSRIVKQSRK
jgi:hypothetical protein